jgi:hypothetical protein
MRSSFAFTRNPGRGCHSVDVTGTPLRESKIDDAAFRRSVLLLLDGR